MALEICNWCFEGVSFTMEDAIKFCVLVLKSANIVYVFLYFVLFFLFFYYGKIYCSEAVCKELGVYWKKIILQGMAR